VEEKHAFTIPAGSLIETDNYVPAIGVTDIGWSGKTATVTVQDFIERIELFTPVG
jgi:hypothetical protein